MRTCEARALTAFVVLLGLLPFACGPSRAWPACDAVEAADVERLRAVAQTTDADDRTAALGIALSRWDPAKGRDLCLTLIDAGADPKGTWPFKSMGRTSAHFLELAVTTGSADVVKRLIAKGADVKGPAGGFALIRAAESRRPAIVRLLLDAGADPAFEYKGETPLGAAERGGDPETIQLFGPKGARR